MRAARQPGHLWSLGGKGGTQGLLAAPVRPGTGLKSGGVLPEKAGAQCLEKMRPGTGRQCRGAGVCVGVLEAGVGTIRTWVSCSRPILQPIKPNIP